MSIHIKSQDVATEDVILGARDLGKQINKTIPTYEVLLQQIEEFRVTAHKASNKAESKIKQDYVNTVGIFGQRGTGKSSVLYTLRNDLSKEDIQPRHNILLELIEPDKFGENTKIIGSIVGLLVQEAHELIKKMKNPSALRVKGKSLYDNADLSAYYNQGIFKPSNPLKQGIDKTIEYHLYTENQYRTVLNQHFEDVATHIRKSERLLIPDIEFQKAFYQLVEDIIKVQKAINKQSDNVEDQHEVLIFVFIDDIDLNTSKTRELIDGLLKCTNHPNIVTVLSGDYDILYESMTLALLADEPLAKLGLNAYDSLAVMKKKDTNSSENSAFTIMERKTGLAHEYLKKIIPPAGRHQVVKWTEVTIPNFSFGSVRLVDQLAELMGEQSVFGYKDKNELEESHLVPIASSYAIFDERPRGLVNAYYHLVQLLKVVKNPEKKEENFRSVKMFIDTLVLSNQKLLPHQEVIFEQFLIWGTDEKSTFIDYAKLKELKDIPVFELLILAEVVKHLLAGVRYDQGGFVELKKQLFKELLLSKDDRSTGADLTKHSYQYPLYQMMRGFVTSIDMKASLLLLEYLSQQIFDSYYYIYYGAPEQQEKDRFVIQQISKLVKQYPEALNQIYTKSKVEEIAEATQTIDLLNDICRAGVEFEKTEKIFRIVLKAIDSEYYDNNRKFEVKTANDFQIRRNLFVNTLTNLRTEVSTGNSSDRRNVSSVFVVAKDKFNTLTRTLYKLNQAIAENKKLKAPELIFNILEKNIQELGMKLFGKMEGYLVVSIPLDKDKNNAMYDFYNNSSGQTETKYYLCRKVVSEYFPKSANNLSLSDYIIVINHLEKLSKNYMAWYGQREASNVLTFFKNEAFIQFDSSEKYETDFFTGNEKVALEEYYKYVSSTQEFQEDVQYEKDKQFLTEQLAISYEKIRNETQATLKDFELELEFLEGAEPEGESNA